MKYCLFWATCFIGLLQLSAVTCRSAHDKVIEKEAITLLSSDNEKYSTTVGPSVAYTGQEIERDENSTDKLALEPGVVSSGTQGTRFNWILVFLLVCFGCFILSLLIFICSVVYYYRKKYGAGEVFNRNYPGDANQAQDLQFSTAQLHQPTNAASQQLSLTCQNCHRQSPLAAQFQPVHQLTGNQHQYTKPTVIQFENPVSDLKQPD